jgi:twitching motility protein PilT
MSQIDTLIAKMNQGHFDRAVLHNDKTVLLFRGGEQTAGPVISGAQLNNFLQEILPENLKSDLKANGSWDFPYQSAGQNYHVNLIHNGGDLEVEISPENGAPTVQTPAVPQATGEGNKAIGNIDDLFRMMDERDASDLHLSSNVRPMMRVQGAMITLNEFARNQHDELKKVLFSIAPQRNQEEWEACHDTDFAYEVPGLARFRCNLFSDRHGIGGVFRLIPTKVQTVQDLGLPKAMIDLCNLSKGLVVVTGPTGSGKSTTLAALVDYINKHREDHLITIEDPVEFVHENIKCLVNQREVHVHTESFSKALRAALREDPDICLVGEMRDLETIEIAITTAETGHLVFGTLHTTTAPSTVDRIIDQFPPGQQAQIRVMLSESLKGVIAQTLLKTVDGKRVAAHEILLVPTAVANLIREGKTFQLPSQMQIGKSLGMKTMNESILEFVKEGRVAAFEGYVKATDKSTLLHLYEANNIPIDFEAHEENS